MPQIDVLPGGPRGRRELRGSVHGLHGVSWSSGSARGSVHGFGSGVAWPRARLGSCLPTRVGLSSRSAPPGRRSVRVGHKVSRYRDDGPADDPAGEPAVITVDQPVDQPGPRPASELLVVQPGKYDAL